MREHGQQHHRGRSKKPNKKIVTAVNEYGTETPGKKRVHRKDDPDLRRGENANSFSNEVDHIVPLNKVYQQLRNNYGLTDDDIRDIANIQDNLAIIPKGTNVSKLNEYNEHWEPKNPNLDVSPQDRAKMNEMSRATQKKINAEVNKKVTSNIMQMEPGLMKNNSKVAFSQSTDYLVGNLIFLLIKPLYYEIADIFKHGMTAGVNASSTGEALKIRFTRIKDHVLKNWRQVFGGNAWSL